MGFVCACVCECKKKKTGGIYGVIYLLAPTTEAEANVDSNGARWQIGVVDVTLVTSAISLLAGNPIIKPNCRVKSCTASVK